MVYSNILLFLFPESELKDLETPDQQVCAPAEEDMASKETCSLQSENCVEENVSLPVMVEVTPVVDENNIKEIDSVSLADCSDAVTVEENHVKVEGNTEGIVHEGEKENREADSNVYNMEDVD